MTDDDGITGLSDPEPVTPGGAGPPAGSPAATCLEVERAVAREPGDRVRCAHLFGDYYRCNWWSRAGVTGPRSGYDWAGLLTDHVRRSRFLRVTVGGGRLKVEQVTPEAARAPKTG